MQPVVSPRRHPFLGYKQDQMHLDTQADVPAKPELGQKRPFPQLRKDRGALLCSIKWLGGHSKQLFSQGKRAKPPASSIPTSRPWAPGDGDVPHRGAGPLGSLRHPSDVPGNCYFETVGVADPRPPKPAEESLQRPRVLQKHIPAFSD